MSLPSLARVRKPVVRQRESVDPGANFVREIRRSKRAGIAASVISRAALIRLVEFPELPFRAGFRHAVKDHVGSRVIRTTLVGGVHRVSVAYKRIRRLGWKRVRDFLWPRRHLHAWKVARYLVERQVPTAIPIALVMPRRWSFERDLYFATQWLDGAVDLQTHLDELTTHPAECRARLANATAVSLGSLIGQLHGCRVSHRDLKPANLLVNSSGENVIARVVDLDGSHIRFWMSARERFKNLRRLAVGLEAWPRLSLTVRLRFIRAYLLAFASSSENWKSVWKRLATIR